MTVSPRALLVGLTACGLVLLAGALFLAPTLVDRMETAALDRAEDRDLSSRADPPVPEAPKFVGDPPKRKRILSLPRSGESPEERAARLLRRAVGFEEGIERMFARDLEEGEKKHLLELGLEPIRRLEAASGSLPPERRAELAHEIALLASDQFQRARRIRHSAADGEGLALYPRLLGDALRYRAGAEAVLPPPSSTRDRPN